jgi:hypothetical protein
MLTNKTFLFLFIIPPPQRRRVTKSARNIAGFGSPVGVVQSPGDRRKSLSLIKTAIDVSGTAKRDNTAILNDADKKINGLPE